MLSEQVSIYSLDTGTFYTRKENMLHWKINQFKKEKDHLRKLLSDTTLSDDRKKQLTQWKSYKNKLIKIYKERLIEEQRKKLNATTPYIRHARETSITDANIVAVFDSFLTRTLQMDTDALVNDEICIVRVFYFDVAHDIIKNGFYFHGNKYIYLTSSAGQIRTKKTVFIREDLWQKHELTFTNGLTRDVINAHGGMNSNKYLAYLALLNSATDVWEDFDIDKSIVVRDFETDVWGTYDFIDETDYTVHRMTGNVPIPHTDGCGMILPRICKNKAFMVRMPWIKGLLAPFDFHKFILRNNASWVVEDIYGVKHDVIQENIQVIFTKSQLKAAGYYANWDEYKENFKKYGCTAGKCNVEEDYIPDATINYQMIQTLTDMTDDELREICKCSNEHITNLTTSVQSMLSVFGVHKGSLQNGVVNCSSRFSYLQQALSIYPELLQDIYFRRNLKDRKDSMLRGYRAAKMEVRGKYTFLIPDLYAFCEYLFLGIAEPKGLLAEGEVFCALYKHRKKLDCLRSPHLYKEHAVRNNVYDKEKAKWFRGNGIYTSTHDMISKILMFDVDGDKSLVVADEKIIEIAERNTQDVVPLYYNMHKANPQEINNENLFQGLQAAFTGGNIGMISNDITKVWNSDVFINGTEEEKQEATHVVKLLCALNNQVIDYAKTLYKKDPPKEVNEVIKSYTKAKVPHFFLYAKGKEKDQVEPLNNSVVNRLETIVQDKKLQFKNIFANKFDYKMLMQNAENVTIDKNVIDEYLRVSRHFKSSITGFRDEIKNSKYYLVTFKQKMHEFAYTDVEIADMLVQYFYGDRQSVNKDLLWETYGDILVANLCSKLPDFQRLCEKCGQRMTTVNSVQKYCDNCLSEMSKKNKRGIVCVDCGKIVKVKARAGKCNVVLRCKECQQIYRKQYCYEYKQKRRQLVDVENFEREKE